VSCRATETKNQRELALQITKSNSDQERFTGNLSHEIFSTAQIQEEQLQKERDATLN
jgi:hypothetical protein